MAGRLAGKVTIITGAANGQGRAAAELFGREGARLVLSDLDGPRLEESAERARDAGAEVAVYLSDLTREEANRELVQSAVDRYGRLDVMYNNAGRGRFAPIHEAALEDWHFTLENELTIVFLGCKHALAAMLKSGSGSIINTASVSGLYGVLGHGVHAATKGGVIGLTRQIAVEYGPRGIRCNALAPSRVESGNGTRSTRSQVHSTNLDEYPLGRYATPLDCVRAALFLASDESSFITGETLIVDGGRSAR